MPLSSDEIWGHIDQQRADLADVLDALTPEQWATPSLCPGWSVRDVAAHLTHSHSNVRDLVVAAVRSGFRFDAMMNRLVLSDNRIPQEVTAGLRAMVGSRRRPPTPTLLDPLMDVLVHGQDIAIPLGIDRPMPAPAAVAVAEHLWRMRFPMNPRRNLTGIRLVADDVDFAVGAEPDSAEVVHVPIRELVMILSGRQGLRSISPDASPA